MTTPEPQQPAMRPSVRATYDSAITGHPYWVTTFVGGRFLGQQRIADPFVWQTVHLGWRDLLRGLLRRGLVVEVAVGGEVERMNDVLELDDQALIRGRTRQAAFQQGMHQKLRAFAADVAQPAPTGEGR